MALHTIQDLKIRQALPLDVKVRMSKQRIREWINEFGIDGVYVSFSGGKDSTVLLDLVRSEYPEAKAMFVDTGLEYPEIRQFVRTFDNVDIVKPKMNFKQVIQTYGYPFISKEVSLKICENRTKPDGYTVKYFTPEAEGGKPAPYNMSHYKFLLDAPFKISHRCCAVMKKNPAKQYEKDTGRVKITGIMATESQLRTSNWLRHGCNAFDSKHPPSSPMSFWTEQDVLNYIKINNLKICSVYGDIVPDYETTEECEGQLDIADYGLLSDNRKFKTTGCQRTGCMFCGYGCQVPKDRRFIRMKKTHPKQYEYIMKPISEGGLGYKEIIDWINENGKLNIKY